MAVIEQASLRASVLALTLLSVASSCTVLRSEAPEPTPLEVSTLVQTAERAHARGDLDTAVSAYQEALAHTPWNTRLESALVASYAERAARARQTDGGPGLARAESDLRAALALRPEKEELRQSLAVVLIEQAARTGDPVRAGAMREEARAYAPDLVEAVPEVEVRLERQLDLAYELIERGQLGAAIDTLERLHQAHPEHAGTTILLARAQVRSGTEKAGRGDLGGAAAAFTRAVRLYAELPRCSAPLCEPAEVALAHEFRIRVLIQAGATEQAQEALAEAAAAGHELPALRERLTQP